MKRKKNITASHTPSLKQLLGYRNETVVAAFARSSGISTPKSKQIFEDMLRFLWLSENHSRLAKLTKAAKLARPGKSLLPDSFEMLGLWYVIDEVWHTFILHSSDYREFCLKYFGKLIDHVPAGNKPGKTPVHPIDIDAYLSFIYDQLGPKIMKRWFCEYSVQYSKVSMIKRQLKQAA